MDFKAAIFDLDGTLLDSLRVWKTVDQKFLNRRGFAVPEDYADEICALSPKECARYTISRFGFKETEEELIREWNAPAAFEYENNVGLLPGAKAYLQRLKAFGVKLAVATSLVEELLLPCLKRNGIYDLFDEICTAGQVSRGKESPELFLFTAEKLGVSPQDCMVFEDVLPAVKSAKQAGMSVFALCESLDSELFAEMQRTADGCLFDFENAPLPD